MPIGGRLQLRARRGSRSLPQDVGPPAASAVTLTRFSALFLVILCPFVLSDTLNRPQYQLFLAAIFLLGIDATAVLTDLASRPWHLRSAHRRRAETPPHPRLLSPRCPVALVALRLVVAVIDVSPRTRASYEGFYSDYRPAYTFFAHMLAQTIYAYGLRPYFLLGAAMQLRA